MSMRHHDSREIFKDIQQRESALQDRALTAAVSSLDTIAPMVSSTQAPLTRWSAVAFAATLVIVCGLAFLNGPSSQAPIDKTPIAHSSGVAPFTLSEDINQIRYVHREVLNTPGTLDLETLATTQIPQNVQYTFSGILDKKMRLSDPVVLKRL